MYFNNSQLFIEQQLLTLTQTTRGDLNPSKITLNLRVVEPASRPIAQQITPARKVPLPIKTSARLLRFYVAILSLSFGHF